MKETCYFALAKYVAKILKMSIIFIKTYIKEHTYFICMGQITVQRLNVRIS